MLILNSNSDQTRKYFFDEFKIFDKKTIESGNAYCKAKGKVIDTLEASITDKNADKNQNLIKLLKDCCPSPISVQGIKGFKAYIGSLTALESLGYDKGPKDQIYIHTIIKDSEEIEKENQARSQIKFSYNYFSLGSTKKI